MRQVSVPVETRSPSGQTNAYLHRGLLVDPAATCEPLERAVSDADIEHIAVTHTHPDHVGAVAEYADRTGATVWGRSGYDDQFTRATGVDPDCTFGDGDRVGPARVVTTPGHARDHVGFVVPAESADESTAGDTSLTRPRKAEENRDGSHRLLCGDLAIAEGSIVVGHPEGDMRAYLTSLRRVLAAGFSELHPGHGPPIEDPEATIRRLIRHRLRREQKILEAVTDTSRQEVNAIVESAYEKDLSGVTDLARATTAAHLAKLARAGRIDRGWLERLNVS